ncbi:MAG: carbonic anhydrase [Sedimentisphaerales bacterium]|nr:carbonic anhydrase [Sedimentisphaerales bacterium]
MASLQDLLDNNRQWAQGVTAQDPSFFSILTQGQAPACLWIGCSDSRVPPEQIVGAGSGELFVHRNIANLVVESDLNCLSVLQYAVEHLKVAHIIVGGHYGCGGLHAALGGHASGSVGEWLHPAQELIRKHHDQLDWLADDTQRWRRLCELNVLEQVANVSRTKVVQQAWHRGQELAVHGWIYELADGLLKDLSVSVTGA